MRIISYGTCGAPDDGSCEKQQWRRTQGRRFRDLDRGLEGLGFIRRLSNKVDAWIDSDPGALFVSNFARVEFAAVVSRQVRVKAMSDTAAREALADFDNGAREMTQLVVIESRDMELAESLVRDFATKLAAPDAPHLALAANRGFSLATFEARLAAAAAMRSLRVVELG